MDCLYMYTNYIKFLVRTTSSSLSSTILVKFPGANLDDFCSSTTRLVIIIFMSLLANIGGVDGIDQSLGKNCCELENFCEIERTQVVCVAVSGRPSEVEIGPSLGGSGERLTLKWSAGVGEVSLVEGSTAGTLARMTVAGSVSASTNKRSSLGRSYTPASMQLSGGKADSGQAENLAQDMADLMHDFDVVSRIGALVGSLKCPYPGLTTDTTATILSQIQASIRQKDEEMSWLDKSCLQLAVRRRDKVETLTFQMQSPSIKEDWVVEHRLSRLVIMP